MRELLAYTDNPGLEVRPYSSFTITSDLVAAGALPGKGALIKAKLLSHVAHGVLSLITLNKRKQREEIIIWSVGRSIRNFPWR